MNVLNHRTLLTAFANAVAEYNRLWATVDDWPEDEYDERVARMEKLARQTNKFLARINQTLDKIDLSEKIHDGLAYVRPCNRGITIDVANGLMLEEVLPEGACHLVVYRSEI